MSMGMGAGIGAGGGVGVGGGGYPKQPVMAPPPQQPMGMMGGIPYPQQGAPYGAVYAFPITPVVVIVI